MNGYSPGRKLQVPIARNGRVADEDVAINAHLDMTKEMVKGNARKQPKAAAKNDRVETQNQVEIDRTMVGSDLASVEVTWCVLIV